MYGSNIQSDIKIIIRQTIEILIANVLTKIKPLKLKQPSQASALPIPHKNLPANKLKDLKKGLPPPIAKSVCPDSKAKPFIVSEQEKPTSHIKTVAIKPRENQRNH